MKEELASSVGEEAAHLGSDLSLCTGEKKPSRGIRRGRGDGHQELQARIVFGVGAQPNGVPQSCPPQTSGCDLIWEQGLCRCNEGKNGDKVIPNEGLLYVHMSVLTKIEPEKPRHRCRDGGKPRK